MSEAIQNFVNLVMQGVAWVLEMAAALWLWSWTQISSMFTMSWADLPGWKVALGVFAVFLFAGALIVLALRGWHAVGRIAQAFWTMALAVTGMLAFVIAAGLFSRGFQWVVATVPDNFWERYL
jgi:hypothetical protein